MSRYRPPRPKASPYITPEGQARLQSELTYLWKEKRPAVTAKVSEAAAMGDRSENAEYIYGKRQLREIDARIQFLSRRLDELEVIDRHPTDINRVYFGARVTLEDEAGRAHTYRIVGADEIDAGTEHVSIDAPLARALIGKARDDEVTIEVQRQAEAPRVLDPGAEHATTTYVIVDIAYGKET